MIEMNTATEGYSDLVKCIEDGFTEIDNDIIVDLRKQDDNYLALCRKIGDMEKEYLLEPGRINHSESNRNSQFGAKRKSQCTSFSFL